MHVPLHGGHNNNLFACLHASVHLRHSKPGDKLVLSHVMSLMMFEIYFIYISGMYFYMFLDVLAL